MLNPSFRRQEYNKRKREQFYIRAGVFLFLILLLIVGIIFVSRMQRFRISNVDFVGGLLVSPDEIKTETKNFIAGNYLFFFPKNNIILYPHKELENFLKEKFKRIDKIAISTVNNQSIRISIKERGLYALWCANLPEDPTEKCYFMDNNSVIFSEAPTFSGDAYFKYFGSISPDINPIGLPYIASTIEFNNLSSFVERVKNTRIRPVYLVAKENNQFDLVLSDGGKIYLDDTIPFSKLADNLDVLLQTLSSSTSTKDFIVDYIDLRFGNKLFYKLK